MTVCYIDQDQIAESLSFPRLIDYMMTALAQPTVAPLRFCMKGNRSRELLIMPVMSARFAGAKILSVVPENGANGLPVINGLFILMDGETGVTLATMDAGELTARRTAAVSALASRRLSRANSDSLLILGTGHLAPYLAAAHGSVRRLRRIAFWGRCPQKAEACRKLVQSRMPDVQVKVTLDLKAAVQSSDIISAATRSQEPLIYGKWILAGTHIDLVGGYRPDMREIDDVGLAKASIYVDTIEGALAEAGDLRSPIERGIISETSILGDISALANGVSRVNDDEITLFKSVGSAVSDLVAAELVWQSHRG